MPNLRNFRDDYLSDWKMKVIDAVGHVFFAFIIWTIWPYKQSPWIMLVQWFPDIFLYPRWLYGMLTGKYYAADSILRECHLFMHSLMGLGISFIVLLVNPFLGVNMFTHLVWDFWMHLDLPEEVR